jgi:hypothetical protein
VLDGDAHTSNGSATAADPLGHRQTGHGSAVLVAVRPGLAHGCPVGGLAARQGEPRGPRRRWPSDGGPRSQWTRPGAAQPVATAAPDADLPLSPGAPGGYPKAHRWDAPPGHGDGRSPGGGRRPCNGASPPSWQPLSTRGRTGIAPRDTPRGPRRPSRRPSMIMPGASWTLIVSAPSILHVDASFENP